MGDVVRGNKGDPETSENVGNSRQRVIFKNKIHDTSRIGFLYYVNDAVKFISYNNGGGDILHSRKIFQTFF